MAAADLPTFDLVCATVDRTEPLDRLLTSIELQGGAAVRVIVVDQNADDAVARALDERSTDLPIVRIRAERGLSRARNAALPMLAAEIVAFPDDDCTYPPGLLERVARRFADDPSLDGLSGSARSSEGDADASWAREPAVVDADNLWNRVISFGIFLRRDVVERTGAFDERLGLGSGSLWSSGEEVEYVLRAIHAGARIDYDPSFVVTHAVKRYTPTELRSVGLRDGASVGWILRRHRYGFRSTVRMLARPLGGIGASLGRGDVTRASFHAATFVGRVRGYLGARSS